MVSYVYTCTGAKSLQLCLTLCDPMDCSPTGSSVHRTLQARALEWVVIPFSRRSSQPRGWTNVSYIPCTQVGSLSLVPPGKPLISVYLSSKLLKLHTLSMYSFLYVNHASIKWVFLKHLLNECEGWEREWKRSKKNYPIERRLIVLPGSHCQTQKIILIFMGLLLYYIIILYSSENWMVF